MIQSSLNDRTVVAPALEALRAHALDSGQGDEIIGSGALKAILDAAMKHAGDAAVCESACAALGNLAFGTITRKEAYIVRAGALAVLVTVLRTCEMSPEVCERAF